MESNVGYRGIGPEAGTFIPESEAFAYALERCQTGTKEEKKEFIEWYYSGNWIRTGEQ
mgnify:CR=1 FL=1